MIPAIQSIAGVPSAGLPTLPPMLAFWVGVDAVLVRNRSGTGDSLTDSGSNVILADAGGAFSADDVPQLCTLSGWTNPGNNGTFPVTAQAGGTQLTMQNAAAVTEVNASGQWRLHGRVSSITDRVNSLNATPAATATALVADSSTHASGKVMIGDLDVLANQLNSVANAGIFGALSGDVDSTIIAYGYRIASGPQVGSYGNVANTHYNRVSLSSTTMQNTRAAGGSTQNVIITNALVGSGLHNWAWTWDNTTAGLLEAFKNSASMGTGSPATKFNPAGVDTIRLASGSSVGHGFIWRGWGIANYRMTPAQMTIVKNYLDIVYA